MKKRKKGFAKTPAVIIVVVVVAAISFAVWHFLHEPEGAPTPPLGGTLTIAHAEDANILDPARTDQGYALEVNSLIYDALITLDDNMNYIPLLAENWSWHENENNMYIEFKLREDVKFHCGHPFTADAVVYSINRVKDSWVTSLPQEVQSVKAVDNYTVRVYVSKESRYILDWFIGSAAQIVCPHCAEEYGTYFGTLDGPPCGTGPFKFKEWVENDRIVLERFDDYTWGPERYHNKGPAFLDNVIFRVIQQNQQKAKFEAGEVDFVADVGVSSERLESWENNPEIELHIVPSYYLIYLGFNCASTENHGYSYENGEISPGSVSKAVPKVVRQAIAYALDENKIIDVAYAGVATPATSWLADTIWSSIGYQKNMYPYDPERAREILDNAGYGGGFTLEVISWPGPQYSVIATEIARQLENVGITLTYQSLGFNMAESKVANKDYNMFVGGYNWPLADMIWWEWHTVRLPSPNRFWWGDNYTDAIIENTFSFDDEVALRALQESQRLIAEDAAGVGLLYPNFIIAHSSRVKGFDISGLTNRGPTGFLMRVPWHFLDTYIDETE